MIYLLFIPLAAFIFISGLILGSYGKQDLTVFSPDRLSEGKQGQDTDVEDRNARITLSRIIENSRAVPKADLDSFIRNSLEHAGYFNTKVIERTPSKKSKRKTPSKNGRVLQARKRKDGRFSTVVRDRNGEVWEQFSRQNEING